MAKFTIDLDGTTDITKGPRDKAWTATVTADLDKLPAGIIADLALHGLKQKVADAASGAKTRDEALGPMQKALDAIMRGEWSSRGSGADGTRNLAIVRIYRAAMPDDVRKRFNKLDAKEQVEKAIKAVTDEALIAAEVAKIEEERRVRAEEEAARKAQVAELAKGMTFDF